MALAGCISIRVYLGVFVSLDFRVIITIGIKNEKKKKKLYGMLNYFCFNLKVHIQSIANANHPMKG